IVIVFSDVILISTDPGLLDTLRRLSHYLIRPAEDNAKSSSSPSAAGSSAASRSSPRNKRSLRKLSDKVTVDTDVKMKTEGHVSLSLCPLPATIFLQINRGAIQGSASANTIKLVR